MARRTFVVVLFSVLLLAGCEKISSIESDVKSLKDSNLALSSRMSDIERGYKDLEKKFLELENSIVIDRIVRDRSEAEITPSDEGFNTVQTVYGMLTVQCKGIEPYADGSKVRVVVGNPLSCGFMNTEISIKYGVSFANYTDGGWADWQKTLRRKSFKLSESINAGSWNSFTVALPGVSPDKMGYIAIKLEPATMLLRGAGR